MTLEIPVSIKEIFSRSTLANVVAGIVVIAGTAYFIYSGDVDSLKWVAAIGLGWLFKEAKDKAGS